MHPFWAARRITDAELRQEQNQALTRMTRTGETLRLPNFNCAIVTKVHTKLDIATVGDQNLTSTGLITVPYITNVKDVLEGEDLIVRHYPRATGVHHTCHWMRRRRKRKDEEAQATKKAKHTEEVTAVAAA